MDPIVLMVLLLGAFFLGWVIGLDLGSTSKRVQQDKTPMSGYEKGVYDYLQRSTGKELSPPINTQLEAAISKARDMLNKQVFEPPKKEET